MLRTLFCMIDVMANPFSYFRYCAQIPKIIRFRGLTMTSVSKEKVLEKLEKNPYYEKYAQRLAELQRTAPDEFLQRVESTVRRSPSPGAPPDTRQFSSVLNPKDPRGDVVTAEDKKLDEIFKVELVNDKDAAEIKTIWEQYHQHKEVISATIPVEQYLAIHEKMQNYSTFLFPLPRSQGYEFIMSQCSGHTIHFTPLLAYQVHKENAPECLTIVHYTELRDKGIILMRGEYDKNVLSGKEAQCLANQFQMYYSGKDSVKLQLLQTFTEHPDTFKHMELITQLENIGL